jgi:hypothetical protein
VPCKLVHVRYTNGGTAKAYYYPGDSKSSQYWIHTESGRKIPWNTVQAWMS